MPIPILVPAFIPEQLQPKVYPYAKKNAGTTDESLIMMPALPVSNIASLPGDPLIAGDVVANQSLNYLFDPNNANFVPNEANYNKNLMPLQARVIPDNLLKENNFFHKGIQIIINVTAVPGGDTISPTLYGVSATGDVLYEVLVGANISTISTTILKVYPSITPVANLSVSDVLPALWLFKMEHSGTGSFTYSVDVSLNK